MRKEGSTASDDSSIAISSRLRAYLALIRVPNSLMIGLAVLVGEIIALGAIPSYQLAVPGFLSASLLMAGTMVMNDIYDMEADRVNSPQRPIPSGTVKIREAYVFASLLSAAGVGFSVLLGPRTTLIALLALALMLYYNILGKRTGLMGNVVVSFNVALPFVYGGVAVDSLRPSLFIFSLLAFLANLGREVAKGIADTAGDSLQGNRTLAVARGPRAAALVSASLFLTAVVLSILPPILGLVSILYFPSVVLADLGFIHSAYRLLSDQKAETARKVKTRVLLWMLLGLVGFLLGGSPRLR